MTLEEALAMINNLLVAVYRQGPVTPAQFEEQIKPAWKVISDALAPAKPDEVVK